jgi:hypothetical protein
MKNVFQNQPSHPPPVPPEKSKGFFLYYSRGSITKVYIFSGCFEEI